MSSQLEFVRKILSILLILSMITFYGCASETTNSSCEPNLNGSNLSEP
jgi:hypothetical protein